MLTRSTLSNVISFSYECLFTVADFFALRAPFAQMSLKLDVSLPFSMRLLVEVISPSYVVVPETCHNRWETATVDFCRL